MKANIIFTLLTFFIFISFIQVYPSPNGTYKFNTKSRLRYNAQSGVNGEIRVKQIAPHRIILCLYHSLGAPTYNSGSFVDTLAFNDGVATYTNSDDAACQIRFTFTSTQIQVSQLPLAEKNPFSCGFGYGVNVSGIYRKTNSAIPIIKDLSAD